jgi:dTDP-4-amino-4,6-dideoxygalactose transaminase
MKVPFQNLKIQNEFLARKEDNLFEEVIKSGIYLNGPDVKLFEHQFALFLGAESVLACANATEALEVVLRALDLKVDDEVILPANTWLSLLNTISLCNLRPVFSDVSIETSNITIDQIEAVITPKTKAIIVVHTYGRPVEIQRIKEFCTKHNIFLIEDCSHAHGAEYNGNKVGVFGDAAIFSFYPTKILGALGNAGCIVSDEKFLDKCRIIINNGLSEGQHKKVGRNALLDDLQARILLEKLKYLNGYINKRIKISELYQERLCRNYHIITPNTDDCVFHLYVIRTQSRDQLKKYLDSYSIETKYFFN